MKLDRNITEPRRGKYALIKLRGVKLPFPDVSYSGIRTDKIVPTSAIDYGDTTDSDFFVIRLKDKYAAVALEAYASKAREDGQTEYAAEIMALALNARNHPNQKQPD